MNPLFAAARPPRHPIASFLRERGITNRSLATVVGCSESHLSAVISGAHNPSRLLRSALSLALDAPASELFRD